MVRKSDGLGLRMEIATVQVLEPAKGWGTGKSMCVSILVKWLWWLHRNAKEGISMKDQAWHMKTHPDVTHEIMAWDLADTGGKWVIGKPFRIKLMLLLWILLSSAVLLWGCSNNFWMKAWTCFLVFCLFMTWYRSIYCHSGCIFLCSLKHYLNSPSACSRICHLWRLMWCIIFPACQPCPFCFLSLNQPVGRRDKFSIVYRYVPEDCEFPKIGRYSASHRSDIVVWDPQEDVLMI